MARINLRPWREELRQEKQQQFVMTLLFVLILAGAALFGWHNYLNGLIDDQRARNSYIEQEASKLQDQITEIDKLRQERKRLIDRMKVIQELQGNRPVVVKMFDELVRTVPDGVYYDEVALEGNLLNINGVADSNNRISSLMRNFDQSEWFKDPNLTSVMAIKESSSTSSNFKLAVIRTTPGEEEEEGTKGRRARR